MNFANASAQVNTWRRAHGTSGQDYAQSIKVAPDGNFIVAGTSNGSDTTGTNNFYIMKLDSSNGNKLWSISIGDGGYENLTAMKISKNGDIIAAGVKAAIIGNPIKFEDVIVCRISQQGNLLWQQTYQLPDTQFCKDLVELPDYSICIIGYNLSPQNVKSGMFLKIDSAGTFIAIKKHIYSSPIVYLGIVFTHDSILMVNAMSNELSVSSILWMIALNDEGDTTKVKWTSFYKSNAKFPMVQTLCNNFIQSKEYSDTWSWIHIVRHDSTGNYKDYDDYGTYYSFSGVASPSLISCSAAICEGTHYGVGVSIYKDSFNLEFKKYATVVGPIKDWIWTFQNHIDVSFYLLDFQTEGLVALGSAKYGGNGTYDYVVMKFDQNLALNFDVSKPIPNIASAKNCESDSTLLYVKTNKKKYTTWVHPNGNVVANHDSIYVVNTNEYVPISYDDDSNYVVGQIATIQYVDTSINPILGINGLANYCKYDGDTAILTATANGNATYQWQLNNIDIPGAINNVCKANGIGTYQCLYNFGFAQQVSNLIAINDSSKTKVDLNTSLGIYRDYCIPKMDPLLKFTTINNNATFNWYNNDSLVYTGTTLPIANYNDSIWYIQAVTGCGTDTSLYAYYIDEPLQQTIACNFAGDTIDLCLADSIELCGGGTAWKRNNLLIPNVQLPLYIKQTGTYQYQYTTGNCTTWSLPIYITDNLPKNLQIISSPNDTVCDSIATLNVVPVVNNCIYTWYKDGVMILDSTILSVNEDGWYKNSATVNGCPAAYTDSIFIKIVNFKSNLTTLDTNLNLCKDSILIYDLYPDTDATYTWYKNNFQVALANPTFSLWVTDSGKYQVKKEKYLCNSYSPMITTYKNIATSLNITNSSCVTCNGSIKLTTDSALQLYYLWSTGQTINAINNLCQNLYTVTVSNTYCTKTLGINILSMPFISAFFNPKPPDINICNGKLNANIVGGKPPYSITCIPPATDTTLCQNTSYTINITDSLGCVVSYNQAYFFATINDTIWPGDADNNNIVDNYDLLPIIMHHDETGFIRTNQSISWQPLTPTFDWLGILQQNGKNRKHVDCNGNGVIDTNDAAAIKLNYNITGKTNYPLLTDLTGPPSKINTTKLNYINGEYVDLLVTGGSSIKKVQGLKFIGAQLEIPSYLVEPGTFVATDSSNQLYNYLENYKMLNYDTSYQVDFAQCIFDNIYLNQSYGELFRIKFKLNSNLPSNLSHTFSIKNYLAINNFDTAILMNVIPLTLTFNSYLYVDFLETHGVSIYPIPAKDYVDIYSPNERINQLDLIDTKGNMIYTFMIGENNYRINLKSISNGNYYCNIYLNSNIKLNKRITVLH
ncbi:MAG: hypothetical protein IPO27_02080 [Bacteroidetes bacterium]|nr:hypothetical protein [Bacteroidota bacterium]